jgi:2-keto-4-pentenoate hydratase/2-oxohepta-3-ene-1,7-dioic acid hydratase in catechol pathway
MAAIGRFQKGEDIFYAKIVDGEIFRLQGDVFGSPSFDKKPTPRKGVRTLVPVSPSKVIAVGLNYADHAREQNKPLPKEPLIWIKATTSCFPMVGKIEIPHPAHRTDYEAELAIVIGRKIRNVTAASASRYIWVTQRRRTSATGIFRLPKASGVAPSHSIPSRRSGRTSRQRLIRRT